MSNHHVVWLHEYESKFASKAVNPLLIFGPPASLRGGCGDLAVCGEVAGTLRADLRPIADRTATSSAVVCNRYNCKPKAR